MLTIRKWPRVKQGKAEQILFVILFIEADRITKSNHDNQRRGRFEIFSEKKDLHTEDLNSFKFHRESLRCVEMENHVFLFKYLTFWISIEMNK